MPTHVHPRSHLTMVSAGGSRLSAELDAFATEPLDKAFC